jgi:hypothetical protein
MTLKFLSQVLSLIDILLISCAMASMIISVHYRRSHHKGDLLMTTLTALQTEVAIMKERVAHLCLSNERLCRTMQTAKSALRQHGKKLSAMEIAGPHEQQETREPSS